MVAAIGENRFPKNTARGGQGGQGGQGGVGDTKIVGFCNYQYRSIGIAWYHRMTQLGYTTHQLVATDQEMVDYLQAMNNNNYNYNNNQQQPSPFTTIRQNDEPPRTIRFETMLRANIPQSWGLTTTKAIVESKAVLDLLMAVRWKFLYQQLQNGIHILLTDVDNIFTRYVPMSEFEQQTTVDVWHAYATKFPTKEFREQGFVVCSGMSWWRASPEAIAFAKLMTDACGDRCDDQRVLNRLLVHSLNMTWDNDITPDRMASRTTNRTESDPRMVGLFTKEIFGRSLRTHHTTGIWNRSFAYRGSIDPRPYCPQDNWVSMPILNAKARKTQWKIKLDSFDDWDRNCGSALTRKKNTTLQTS